jgi:hypothetical protein
MPESNVRFQCYTLSAVLGKTNWKGKIRDPGQGTHEREKAVGASGFD